MTSAEYRARAEKLLTSQHPLDLNPTVVEQAAVWAQLATAAAITEANDRKIEAR
ncbi:hypothetical protein GPZ77_20290 [Streptomyces sp. QHH-9511]|uniref:hypothetical protein n=1 Tax=Streptomyces sp. QHH-9511 TaxID=2684468 RepID=UPI001316950F|nr:hypothetical protein [Streptomyces sp. QHH-9511]QGZ50390.1 hypothetical protein GPZ77_20290 [Streptomyces sp. QHH-9511]